MNVVIFGPYALWAPHFETDLEIAETRIAAGADITWFGCDGELESCEPNRTHRRDQCLKCIGRRKAGLKLLSSSVTSARHEEHLTAEDRDRVAALPRSFEDLDALRALKLDTFDLGMASLSSMFEMLRDVSLDVREHQRWIGQIVRSAARVFLGMRNYLRAARPDCVYVFNGRMSAMRGVLRACQEVGVDCHIHERGRDTAHYLVTTNEMSHEIDGVERRIEAAWARERFSREDKVAVAERWYEGRTRGHIGSWFSFTDAQAEGRLPSTWDAERRNVGVYTSSEYEHAAIDDAWKNPLFEVAADGLQELIERCGREAPDIHFNLRLHPSPVARESSTVKMLMALDAANVTVIPPDSEVSTYALMLACEKIVVTASSVGIEAAFWGKPVILAGASEWGRLGSAYTPQTFTELVDLVCDPALAPLDREGALKFGYYMATLGLSYEYFQPEGVMHGTFKGKHIRPRFLHRMQARIARLMGS